MSQDEQFDESDALNSFKKTVTSLVDAVIYSERAEEAKSKANSQSSLLQHRLEKFDEFREELTALVHRFVEENEPDRLNDLEKRIVDYAVIALDQEKVRVKQEMQKQQQELVALAKSEETKALKSVETFLAGSPLPVQEKSVTIKLVEGAYEAKVKYRCNGEIEYEFLLDAKKVDFFHEEFRLSKLKKEIKVPARLAKSWLKKEPIPDFERLDQYILSEAEASINSAMAVFEDPESDKKIKLVYSKSDQHMFVTVEYIDSLGTVDVTAEPALNKHLDAEPLKDSMEMVSLALFDLEKHKLRLLRLTSQGEDVLGNLKYFDFLVVVAKVIAQKLKEPFAEVLFAQENALDLNQVSERLKALGDRGLIVAEAFGLPKFLKNQ
jgi:hypothetical protein